MLRTMTEPPSVPPAPPPKKTSGLAIAAFVLSLILCFPPLSILGAILGIVALVRMGGRPELGGKTLSIVSIPLGALSVVVTGVLAAILIPNFVYFNARAKTVEAKGNLQALATAEMSYQAEHSALTADMAAIGFRPEHSNRYAYFLAASGPTERRGTTASVPPAHPVIIDVDTGKYPYLHAFATFAETGCPLGPPGPTGARPSPWASAAPAPRRRSSLPPRATWTTTPPSTAGRSPASPGGRRGAPRSPRASPSTSRTTSTTEVPPATPRPRRAPSHGRGNGPWARSYDLSAVGVPPEATPQRRDPDAAGRPLPRQAAMGQIAGWILRRGAAPRGRHRRRDPDDGGVPDGGTADGGTSDGGTPTAGLRRRSITALTPSQVFAGDGAFTLTLTGTGFASDATVTVGGVNVSSHLRERHHPHRQRRRRLDADGATLPVVVTDPTPTAVSSAPVDLRRGQPRAGDHRDPARRRRHRRGALHPPGHRFGLRARAPRSPSTAPP